ncbi:hypothetical protein VCHENC02_0265A, partial [Vibrio harveyi]
MAGLA